MMKRATAITVARKKIAKENRVERRDTRCEERGKKEWWMVLLKKKGMDYIETGYAVPENCMGGEGSGSRSVKERERREEGEAVVLGKGQRGGHRRNVVGSKGGC
jgi:hypothetical protein